MFEPSCFSPVSTTTIEDSSDTTAVAVDDETEATITIEFVPQELVAVVEDNPATVIEDTVALEVPVVKKRGRPSKEQSLKNRLEKFQKATAMSEKATEFFPTPVQLADLRENNPAELLKLTQYYTNLVNEGILNQADPHLYIANIAQLLYVWHAFPLRENEKGIVAIVAAFLEILKIRLSSTK